MLLVLSENCTSDSAPDNVELRQWAPGVRQGDAGSQLQAVPLGPDHLGDVGLAVPGRGLGELFPALQLRWLDLLEVADAVGKL